MIKVAYTARGWIISSDEQFAEELASRFNLRSRRVMKGGDKICREMIPSIEKWALENNARARFVVARDRCVGEGETLAEAEEQHRILFERAQARADELREERNAAAREMRAKNSPGSARIEAAQEARNEIRCYGYRAFKSGSAKQKAWAEQIRRDFVMKLAEDYRGDLVQIESAKWWIDNRQKTISELFESVAA